MGVHDGLGGRMMDEELSEAQSLSADDLKRMAAEGEPLARTGWTSGVRADERHRGRARFGGPTL